MAVSTEHGPDVQGLVATAAGHAFLGLALLMIAALALGAALDLGAPFVYKAAIAFAAAGALVAALARRHSIVPFGAANGVTLARAALAALLVGFVGEPATPASVWSAIGLALTVLLLDGVDGKLARQNGTANAFGARFDMETDAAFILVLSVLAWRFDKAGAWILAGGLMRYGFVLAGFAFAIMRRPLPASRRRQTVCVVQVVSLLVCLAPFVAAPLSGLVVLAGLVALAASFGIDVAWLVRHRV